MRLQPFDNGGPGFNWPSVNRNWRCFPQVGIRLQDRRRQSKLNRFEDVPLLDARLAGRAIRLHSLDRCRNLIGDAKRRNRNATHRADFFDPIDFTELGLQIDFFSVALDAQGDVVFPVRADRQSIG